MGSALAERRHAFVERIDLSRLCLIGRRRQREIGVAARLGKNLELVVDAAVAAPAGIRKRPVSMHERVTRRPGAVEPRKATVSDEAIPELAERSTRVL